MNPLETINQSWNWKKINATEIIEENDFGNVIFKTIEGEYWRVCPEEVCCEKLAANETEFELVCSQTEFSRDWKMENLVAIAKEKLGALETNQKYCLKIPAPIGGEYEESNFGKINFLELLSFAGDLAKQIDGLEDGVEIRLEIKN